MATKDRILAMFYLDGNTIKTRAPYSLQTFASGGYLRTLFISLNQAADTTVAAESMCQDLGYGTLDTIVPYAATLVDFVIFANAEVGSATAVVTINGDPVAESERVVSNTVGVSEAVILSVPLEAGDVMGMDVTTSVDFDPSDVGLAITSGFIGITLTAQE